MAIKLHDKKSITVLDANDCDKYLNGLEFDYIKLEIITYDSIYYKYY